MAETVLRLHGVRKSYNIGTPVEVEVLHGIDLTLERGEFVALIGPSGSGKSTMLNLVGLLERPTAGRVEIAGQDATALDEDAVTRLRGRSIGFVFQFHHLVPAFTAAENVAMPLMLERGHSDAAIRARALDLLDRVGLAAHAHKVPGQLSGGQQQRVAIARALSFDPPLLLADEPTGNLDTVSADEAFALMREFNRRAGITFLLVTHDPRLAQRCDRIIELLDGSVLRDAPSGTALEAR
jgi:lipoprotein-releasing system ATP-binding protein